jgi:hypothetical protein
MIFDGIGPDHSPSSKWYVSPLEFNKTYPPEFNGIYPKYPQGKYMPKINFTFILQGYQECLAPFTGTFNSKT